LGLTQEICTAKIWSDVSKKREGNMPHKRKSLSAKGRLLRKIRVAKENAARLRLAGFIPNALFHEAALDRLVSEAEKKGWGDEATVAEEVGLKRATRTKK
jgi:hypothetical protein